MFNRKYAFDKVSGKHIEWTIEMVKEHLPQVKIQIGKTITMANVSGRKMQFAKVWTQENQVGWEYSWWAIVNSLNNNRPLKPE